MAASPAPATTLLGFLLLTANSVLAILSSRGDVGVTIFVILSYACLVLLFYCLRWFETAPTGSTARDRARVGVWLTTTLLTVMFSWRVSALMPWPVSAGVYCLRRFETAPPGPDGQSLSLTTKFAFIIFLAWGSALATNRVGGDPASVLFVTASYYVWLLLLLCCLRAFGRSTPRSPPAWVQALTRGCRTMDRQSALGIILFAIPMCVSALAVHDVRDDAVSKVLVFVSYAGLLTGVSLFLGTFNDNCTGSPPAWERARHAVRVLSTLLMDRQSALAMILFAIPMCVSALAAHSVRADAVSKVFVFVSYAGLLTVVGVFMGKFNFNDDRDNCTSQGQGQEQGLGGVGAHDAAHGHIAVEE